MWWCAGMLLLSREQLSSIIQESYLLYSVRSEQGLGGRQRWGLWSIYEQGIQRIHVRSFRGWLHFLKKYLLLMSCSSHTSPFCPSTSRPRSKDSPRLLKNSRCFRVDQKKRERGLDVLSSVSTYMSVFLEFILVCCFIWYTNSSWFTDLNLVFQHINWPIVSAERHR